MIELYGLLGVARGYDLHSPGPRDTLSSMGMPMIETFIIGFVRILVLLALVLGVLLAMAIVAGAIAGISWLAVNM